MKKYYISPIGMFALLCVWACDEDIFERTPSTIIGESTDYFNNETALETYTNGLYTQFVLTDILDDSYSDNCEHIGSPPDIRTGVYSMPTSLGSGGWSWTKLRTINYFIYNGSRSSVDTKVLNKYLGIAKFFRALFYFDKVKAFGDVPWYSRPLETNDEQEIYKARDARTVIMDSVLTDLDFAIEYLPETIYKNRISKWTALAYKSRICLYEGTFRKYHTELSLPDAERFLNECVNSAKLIMDSGVYTLYSTGNPSTDYATMFHLKDSPASEVILAKSSTVNHIYYTPRFTSTSNGNYGATNSLISDYPMADGTSFTEAYPDETERETMPFYKEMENRDPRLMQSVIHPGYIRIGTDNVAKCDFNENRTGYQITKRVGTPDEDQGSDARDVILFRYAEVLLNYAEARAVLGSLDQEDLDKTINLIRARVGMRGRNFPLKTDEVQLSRYSSSSDPNVLEIRRERRIELAFEGFRPDDLNRWAEGHLFREIYKGIYIESLNKPIDLDGDGLPDIYVVKHDEELPVDKQDGVQYLRLAEINGLTDGDKGRLRPYNKACPEFKVWEYFDPIPTEELTLNPNLKQNKGWDEL